MRRIVAVALLALADPAIAGSDIVVTDSLDREVRLDRPAERIVALAPHLAENLYTAGAGGRLVGTMAHSDYPSEVRELPEVGGYGGVSLESIVALEPDLVLAWASAPGASDAMLSRMASLGIPVYVNQPRSLDDIADTVVDLGRLAGTATEASRAAADFRNGLAALRHRYGDREPVTVLYQVWNDPLQTISDDHVIGDVIRLCGGRNLFSDTRTLAPRISLEAVLDRDPQVIVASGPGPGRPAWLDDWQRWPGLRAVRHGNLVHVPADVLQRSSVRIVDGARQLCRKLDAARTKATNGSANALSPPPAVARRDSAAAISPAGFTSW
ncbi:cobalamin-binding protein [Spectribacter hydrogenoxidans]|uniref:Cobalamin-binding protein n=1 Tax=Spectribacter hydrogenoxidans TaxID=3075608 RepID=A0ABU3C1Z0_9GAMM|nr:cobalamin-binding protein [Salinisphaera sp. W335]MDT0635576.1 cobalamin-binding protein [Salinisphaera sp. W335]